MQKNFAILSFLCLTLSTFLSCRTNDPTDATNQLVLLDSIGWIWEIDNEEDLSQAAFTTQTDLIPLHFFGWNAEEDYCFSVQFPASTEQYGRAILGYTMCGWNQGPSDWDMTTMIKIEDKQTGEWYEFTRCITPYGGSFTKGWQKTFYIDITEFLPLMRGETRFRIFYCGWDATENRSHAVVMNYYFFEGPSPYGKPTFHKKIYDSTLNGNTGYRSWAYGVEGHSIEDAERLGERTITIPAGTDQAVLRICMTGHGQDKLTGHQGKYPDREGYKPNNSAEFDENWYFITLNGQRLEQRGSIWELNTRASGNQYSQAGTCWYNRCGWGPGKPCNVHHWLLKNIPAEGETITIDLDLDRYISTNTTPKAESVAQFYIEADIYGYKK